MEWRLKVLLPRLESVTVLLAVFYDFLLSAKPRNILALNKLGGAGDYFISRLAQSNVEARFSSGDSLGPVPTC